MGMDYRTKLLHAKSHEVQKIVEEMIENGIELEDVADEEKDAAIYNKVAMWYRPKLGVLENED